MSVGQRQRFQPGGWKARVRAVASTLPVTRADPIRADPTPPTVPPVVPPVVVADEVEPGILGFPVEAGDDEARPPAPVPLRRGATAGLVVVRRADPVGGGLLVWAGVAAAASLWFPWAVAGGDSGLALVRRGVAVLATDGIVELGRSGPWEPVAVVLGGGVLALLGLLLVLPARSRRFVGLVAFVVAEVAAAGIVTELAEAGWVAARFDVGMWWAVAVPVLGVLGALKAMLTAPRLAAQVPDGPPVVRPSEA
jgi:hypothetical protein